MCTSGENRCCSNGRLNPLASMAPISTAAVFLAAHLERWPLVTCDPSVTAVKADIYGTEATKIMMGTTPNILPVICPAP
jgi:hypothetical protein